MSAIGPTHRWAAIDEGRRAVIVAGRPITSVMGVIDGVRGTYRCPDRWIV